jgi:hypothetical protein
MVSILFPCQGINMMCLSAFDSAIAPGWSQQLRQLSFHLPVGHFLIFMSQSARYRSDFINYDVIISVDRVKVPSFMSIF